MRKLLLASAAALATASMATAADLPMTKAEPVAPLAGYDWTGLYVGAHLGYLWGDVEAPQLDLDFLGFPPIALDIDGVIGGAQAGYNLQRGNFVFGIENDVSWSGADGDSVPALFAEGLVSMNADLNWLVTVRGRIGYAFDNLLVYGTGGVAFADFDFDYYDSLNNTYIIPSVEGDVRVGWTLGGGVEYAFHDNWSVKAEYLYMDFGNKSMGFDLSSAVGEPGFGVVQKIDVTAHTVKMGVNYRF